MRKLFAFVAAAALSAPLAAQQPQQKQGEARKAQPQQQDKAEAERAEQARERLRVEGAAGGTRPVPKERREAVNANAGPHLHFTAPSPQELPRDQPIQPGE